MGVGPTVRKVSGFETREWSGVENQERDRDREN
jgi:hypothetical protein